MARGGGWLRALACAALAAPVCAAAQPAPNSTVTKAEANALVFEVNAFLTSDYIYRGVSLSARRPSVGTLIETSWHDFYVSTNVQSVNLPTNPAAEFTFEGGYRPTIADFNFDFGASYFYYPGEMPTDAATKTNYWEYSLDVDRDVTKHLNLSGKLAYAPDVSGTGAWGAYSEIGFELDLPELAFLRGVTWKLMADVGYSRFGNTSPAQGGFPLPAYTNWHTGLVFTLQDNVSLDLSYYDTSLSREDCFVFTGDPMATPGGTVNLVSNPDGLRSRLCGATFVGTLNFKFNSAGKY
ncbi:MAG TPA: TorF family putative porin [Xanthobacteraceae bacterium]